MALDFPASPSLNQVYTLGTKSWVWNGSGWEVQRPYGIYGVFNTNTLSSAAGAGGGSAVFNGTAYRFTLSHPPASAEQLIVSINGVIQKPNAGTSQPAEGFAVDGADILFSDAPATDTPFFIVTIGTTVNIGEPSDNSVTSAKLSDNSVTSAKIVDGAIVDADINASAAIAGNKISPDFGSQNLTTTGTSTAASFIPTSSTIPTNGVYLPGANSLGLSTNGALRATVDSSGRLLVGTSTGAQYNHYTSSIRYQQAGIDGPAGSAQYAVFANDLGRPGVILTKSRGASIGTNTVVQSGDTLGEVIFIGADGSSYTRGAEISCQVDGTPGAGDMPGRLVFSTTADGASSPTERMRITNDGWLIGGNSSDSNPAANNAMNVYSIGVGRARFSTDLDTSLDCNRKGNDGTLVSFRQDGTTEGSISVSGTTVAYNGAHLSRWSQIPGIDPHEKDQRPEILRGTVMSNLDEMCDWIDPESGEAQDNEQLNKTKISDVEGDKNVAGIFQSWDDDDDTWVNDYYLAMTGDFIIRIAAGVTVERGDLLMSAGNGTAKPQDDDIIRSKTIAKVTSTNVSCTYDDGSYCVPCVLMAC